MSLRLRVFALKSTGTYAAGCPQCPPTGWRTDGAAHLDPKIAAAVDTVNISNVVPNRVPYSWTLGRNPKRLARAAIHKIEVIVRSRRRIQGNINLQVDSRHAIRLAQRHTKPRIAASRHRRAARALIQFTSDSTNIDCGCADRDTRIRAGRDVGCDESVKCLTHWLIGVTDH